MREFRARRKSVEQANLGGKSFNRKRKGGTAMGNKVQTKLHNICSVSLVGIGWLVFALANYIDEPITLKVILQAVARVLP